MLKPNGSYKLIERFVHVLALQLIARFVLFCCTVIKNGGEKNVCLISLQMQQQCLRIQMLVYECSKMYIVWNYATWQR